MALPPVPRNTPLTDASGTLSPVWSAWLEKVKTTASASASGAVTSVNGLTGVVSLTTSSISEGSNQYYTDSRADARISVQKAAVNGLATLDSGGKVPSVQLPSYVDDVLEYASLAVMPAPGTSGIIYVADDTGKIYRWSGTAYIEISPSPGSTDSVTEGTTNLYFTQARAIASPLTGYASGAGTVGASDTLLQALQKLDGNTALKAAKGANADITGLTALSGSVIFTAPVGAAFGGATTFIFRSQGTNAAKDFEFLPDTNNFLYGRRSGQTHYSLVINNAGLVGMGKATPAAMLHISTPSTSTSTVPLAVSALSTQNSDLFQIQDSSGVSQVGVDVSQRLYTKKGRLKGTTILTSGASYSALSSDEVIIVNKATGSATTVTFPASPTLGQFYSVKDGKGDAATNNISVSGNGKTLDGLASITLGANYQSQDFIYNGTQWNLV